MTQNGFGFWIFQFGFTALRWDSLLRKNGCGKEYYRRRPVGVKETITSGKKKDPREAEKKGRRRSDYRGKEGTGAAAGPERERRDRGKRENLPQGGNVRIGALHCFAVSAAVTVVHSSLSFCSVQSRRGYRRVQICRVVYVYLSVGGALSLLRISVSLSVALAALQ